MKIKISGIGYYLPDNIETSEELAPKIGKSIDWLLQEPVLKKEEYLILMLI